MIQKTNWLHLIPLLILGINSCEMEYEGEAKRIVRKINSLSSKPNTNFLVIEVDSIRLHPGGQLPSYYKKFYNRDFSSVVDEDIVIAQYQNGLDLQAIKKKDLKFGIENPRAIRLKKGDTLFFHVIPNMYVEISDE